MSLFSKLSNWLKQEISEDELILRIRPTNTDTKKSPETFSTTKTSNTTESDILVSDIVTQNGLKGDELIVIKSISAIGVLSAPSSAEIEWGINVVLPNQIAVPHRNSISTTAIVPVIKLFDIVNLIVDLKQTITLGLGTVAFAAVDLGSVTSTAISISFQIINRRTGPSAY